MAGYEEEPALCYKVRRVASRLWLQRAAAVAAVTLEFYWTSVAIRRAS